MTGSATDPPPDPEVRGGVAGLLLAAGAGRRMGTPKALLRDPDGTAWVTRSARVLVAGGCRPVLVVVGA
ncbi:MAG TPA: NTP transferase domain-containing protein, partial [Actinoplanes sp.]|nr:NTP transferase domain-containing protein [Actinoplanes sp.]